MRARSRCCSRRSRSAAYVFLQHATEERTDEYLAETAGAVAGAMEFERVSGKAFDQVVDDVLEEFRFRDMAVIVLDRETHRMSMLDLGTRPRATSPRTHAAQQLPDLRTILTSTRTSDRNGVRDRVRRCGPGACRGPALPARHARHRHRRRAIARSTGPDAPRGSLCTRHRNSAHAAGRDGGRQPPRPKESRARVGAGRAGGENRGDVAARTRRGAEPARRAWSSGRRAERPARAAGPQLRGAAPLHGRCVTRAADAGGDHQR